MGIKEIHLVVTHPVLGQFIAKKITDPEELENHTFIDRTVNMLESKLRKEHNWPDCAPVVFCKRIEE